MSAPERYPLRVSVGKWLVAIAGIVLAVSQSSWILERSLNFGGLTPSPLRANLALLGLGLGGIVASVSVGVAVALRKLGSWVGVLLVGPASLSLIAVLSSIHPGTAPYVARDQIIALAEGDTHRTLVVPVFFTHALANLSEIDRRKIRDVSGLFRACLPEEVIIRGFASSAEFRQNSDYQNRLLANRRAKVVAEFLEDELQRPVLAIVWAEYSQMAKVRRLRDVGPEGERLRDMERLNRRAEIVWREGSCFGEAAPFAESLKSAPD